MSAAQLVLKKHMQDQITPLLNELALAACQTLLWVQGSNVFIVSLGQYTPILTFSLVCTYQTLHILQSSSKKLLKISKHNLKSFGEHLFPLSFFCG